MVGVVCLVDPDPRTKGSDVQRRVSDGLAALCTDPERHAPRVLCLGSPARASSDLNVQVVKCVSNPLLQRRVCDLALALGTGATWLFYRCDLGA